MPSLLIESTDSMMIAYCVVIECRSMGDGKSSMVIGQAYDSWGGGSKTNSRMGVLHKLFNIDVQ